MQAESHNKPKAGELCSPAHVPLQGLRVTILADLSRNSGGFSSLPCQPMQTRTLVLLKIIWEHKKQRTQGPLEITEHFHKQSPGFDKSVPVFKRQK